MIPNTVVPMISRDMGAALIVGLASGLIVLGWEYFKKTPERKENKIAIQRQKEKEEELQAKEIQQQEFENKKNTLLNLRNKGILSTSEFEEKLQRIKDIEINSQIRELEEFKQLIKLKEEGLLTEREFEEKLQKLRTIHDSNNKSSSSKQRGNSNPLNSLLLSFKEYQQAKQVYYRALTKNSSTMFDGLARRFEEILGLKANRDSKSFVEEVLARLEREQTIKIETPFKNNVALVMDSEMNYGYINNNYDFIVKPKYEFADEFCEDLAVVRLSDKFGYINLKGETVIPFLYDDASSFQNGRATVKIGKDKFYIDKEGNRRSF